MARSKKESCVKIAAKELVMRSIGELIPYANNAKTHSTQQIAKLRGSLREFGFVAPVLIDKAGNIIAGHGRVIAAQAEGMQEVPCVLADGLSEAQRKAYILADNRLAELAEWNLDALDIELQGLNDLHFDVAALGFSQADFAGITVSQHKRKGAGPAVGLEPGCDHFWTDEGESNEEYEKFTEKFTPKLTTDDCYTPANIYECVKNWAVKRYGLEGREVVRPFFPGGDYEKHDYPAGCVVIDNPPFSILSAICNFYRKQGIDFFLFAPALTLFSTNGGKCNYLPVGITLTYENGAQVCSSFVSNLGEYKIETAPDLYAALQEEDDKNRKEGATELPGYVYPEQIIRTADQNLSKRGQRLCIKAEDAVFVRALDEQKALGKAIFGGGFLLSNKAAADKAAAHVWALSEREQEIVRGLGK